MEPGSLEFRRVPDIDFVVVIDDNLSSDNGQFHPMWFRQSRRNKAERLV